MPSETTYEALDNIARAIREAMYAYTICKEDAVTTARRFLKEKIKENE